MPPSMSTTPNREKVSTVELSDAVFGAEVKEHLLYAAVRYQLAKRSSAGHPKGEGSGRGQRWRRQAVDRQKGTGRARQGTIRVAAQSARWRWCRVRPHAAFLRLQAQQEGPPHCPSQRALPPRARRMKLVVLDKLDLPRDQDPPGPGPHSKPLRALGRRCSWSSATIPSEKVVKSARNLKSDVTVLPERGCQRATTSSSPEPGASRRCAVEAHHRPAGRQLSHGAQGHSGSSPGDREVDHSGSVPTGPTPSRSALAANKLQIK